MIAKSLPPFLISLVMLVMLLFSVPAFASASDVMDLARQGKQLFNDKAACFECYGQNGDIHSVSYSQVATLATPPIDLRIPTDKSVRQLYLIVKYGIPATGMPPLQNTTTISNKDILTIIAYLLNLQGSARSFDLIASQSVRPHTDTDVAMSRLCEQEDFGKFDRKEHCEDRYAKRYLDLIVGRPSDITIARYAEIEIICKHLANKDLDTLALCYRAEYTASRQATRQ